MVYLLYAQVANTHFFLVVLQGRGIAKLRLVDFDYVTLSSLNRHATATRADVGIPKVSSVQRTIAAIAPWVQVDPCVELWNVKNEEINGWLKGADWVIDAIDNIGTKVGGFLNHFRWYSSSIM